LDSLKTESYPLTENFLKTDLWEWPGAYIDPGVIDPSLLTETDAFDRMTIDPNGTSVKLETIDANNLYDV
jgi:hypothetical protein